MLQAEELSQQQLSSAEQLQGCQVEILELKRTANTLEIELQAQQNLVCVAKSSRVTTGRSAPEKPCPPPEPQTRLDFPLARMTFSNLFL